MRSVLLTLFLCIFSVAAFAQGDRGTITGTVSDPAGAVVSAAAVEARNLETGAVFPTATTGTGSYTLTQLPVGTYEVTVTVPGFKKYVRRGLGVEVAQTLRVDMTLEVGAASEAVTVSAEASLLKTESGDVSSNVQVNTLDTLPMLGTGSANAGSSGIRNPNNVLSVVPGTYYVPNSQVKINGAQSNSYAYHVEGQDQTNAGFPYAAAQTQPSVDAIQEVSVQTSNFAAEYGAVGGGFFNVTIKSGTNQFHGSAYDYFVNEVLNAGTPFTNAGASDSTKDGQLIRPRSRRNDYGFTFGGPVDIPHVYNGHDKTFFFFNFEQYRETQIINNVPITVPTAAYRTGDFSGAITADGNKSLGTDVLGRTMLAGEIYNPATRRTVSVSGSNYVVEDPFLNNAIPSNMQDPVALKVQSLIPAAGIGSINNYQPAYAAVRHTTIPALKIDQLVGSKQKFSFYWSKTRTYAPFSPIYGGSEGLPSPITADRGSFIGGPVERLNWDYTATPTMLLHIGVGYQQNDFFDDAPNINYNAATSLGLTGATIARNFPIFQGLCSAATGCTTAAGGTMNMGPVAGQTHSFWEKPSTNGSLTWIHGNHTVKGGTDMYWSAVPQIAYSNTMGAYTFSPNETAMPYLVGQTLAGGSLGFNYASFLLGDVDSYNIAAVADFRQAKKQLGFFLQDSWKVTRKFTLEYGVRYDFGTYYQEEHGRAVDFSAATPNPSAGGALGGFLFEGTGAGRCNCQFANNYPYAFGPRIGIAYSINDKTVIRAGWGVIYGASSINPLGINSAGIVNTNSVSTAGSGLPAMTLAGGIPTNTIPTWPVFSPGVAPIVPSGGQVLPAGVVLLDPNAGRPPRQNQWSIGIQREVTRNLAVEASYVGNRGVWWQAPSLEDVNAITPSILAAHGLSLNNPANVTLLSTPLGSVPAATLAQYNLGTPYSGFSGANTVAQSLRPFPQFANIPVSGDPLGKTWYDSMQSKLTLRPSHGLVLTSTFTWQKSLQVGTDGNVNPTVPQPGGGAPTNYVNNTVLAAQQSKSISLYDQPFLFVVAGSYTLPKAAALGKASYILQDWQIGTLLSYSSGLPIPVPASTSSIASQVFQGALDNRVPGVPLYLVSGLNCHCFDPNTTPVLNPAAWAAPAAGQFGTSAPFYSDYRYPRHPAENINLGRTWRFKERMSLNLRVEFSNFLNRTYLNNVTSTNPTTPVTHNAAGQLTGGFGWINTAFSSTNQLAQPRNGTIVARFSF